MTNRPIHRYCGVALPLGGAICNAPASIHIAREVKNGIVVRAAWVCLRHELSALIMHSYYDAHDVGPCCGMPGAKWDTEGKTCIYDEEIEVTDEVEHRDLVPAI